jgi:hypothetical protein
MKLSIKSGLRQSEIRDQQYGEIELKLSALIGLVKLCVRSPTVREGIDRLRER